MWTHEASIVTSATPGQIWALFADVPGWKSWNAGIAQIAIHGPFAVGTRFEMQPPGEEAFTSTLTEVIENVLFTDETVIDDTKVIVRHQITPQADGQTRISYCTEITGPAAAAFGPMVTGDFPQVLAVLKARAEQG